MEHIAIVGIGCRFPGAASPDELWGLLLQGRSAVSTVPRDRWDIDELFSADPSTPGKISSRFGAFLDGVADFDAEFFGISPREAPHLDPQQRLLLEVVWEAFEDGGLPPSRLPRDRAGVFVGIMGSDHTHRALGDLLGMNAHTGAGIGYCLAANRLSYQFDFGGPSMAIDTACSSSLVATHLACQSLRSGECDVAVAAGVNIILSPALNVFYSKAGLLSPDGACRTFDAAANGIVRGEGAGAVVLKRLSDAVADGDRIYAVVRGSAVNQDGRSNGLTAPNRWAQERVVRAAYQQAGVAPSEVSYVELHGTGTLLGDPIEAQALATVLGPGRRQPCAVGSIKTNMGHLEGAAGIAGLIKAALMLNHRRLVPSLHFKTLNPHIAAANLPLRVQTEASPFPDTGGVLVAGVSSFGLGGTNAHVVLEELSPAQGLPAASRRDGPGGQLLRLSAPTEQGLGALAGRCAEFLAGQNGSGLRDTLFTTNSAREQFSHRLALVVDDPAAAASALRGFHDGKQVANLKHGRPGSRRPSKIGFMFSGQGAQYAGMASELYRLAPVFRDSLDECARIADRMLPTPLLSAVFPGANTDRTVHQTRYSQPALFAVEYALSKLLASWGIEPDVVLGHSVGEYVAACVAGAYSLEDGVALVVERARLMSELTANGGMLAVLASAGRVRPFLEGSGGAVVIAGFNGPENTVLSGESSALTTVKERLNSVGIRCVTLDVSMPFHSPHIAPMAAEFEDRVAAVRPGPLAKPMISTLTGRLLTTEELASPPYWSRQACEPVLFEAAVRAMQEAGCNLLVEVGPRATLTAMASHFVDASRTVLVPTLRADSKDWKNLADCVGALYVRGVNIDWAAYESVLGGRKVSVPTFPFQRKRHWKQYSSSPQPAALDVLQGVDSVRGSGVRVSSSLRSTAESSVLEAIREIVAKVGQTSLAAVNVTSRPYNDLGFDSLMLVELKTAIATRFPGVEDLPLGRFFAGATVDGIATHVASAIDKPTPNGPVREGAKVSCPNEALDFIATWAGSRVDSAASRLDRHLVHKEQPENVLLVRLDRVAPDVVVAEVLQNTSHAFFYEHAKDHVPGLYLIEAARQFGIALAHLYYDVPLDRPFIMDDLHVRFFRFAETARPLFVIGHVHEKSYQDGHLAHMRTTATFVQDGMEVCAVEGNFLISDPEWYAKKRNLNAAHAAPEPEMI